MTLLSNGSLVAPPQRREAKAGLFLLAHDINWALAGPEEHNANSGATVAAPGPVGPEYSHCGLASRNGPPQGENFTFLPGSVPIRNPSSVCFWRYFCVEMRPLARAFRCPGPRTGCRRLPHIAHRSHAADRQLCPQPSSPALGVMLGTLTCPCPRHPRLVRHRLVMRRRHASKSAIRNNP